ncbi:hypothetical protein ACFYVD_05875 [Rhodococcus pyridinivorans]|uniref:hypothetical protein n=1 Tax=Rhodococcus pyridinivorans TaxID=103816 RepID=UPI0036B5B1C9
MREVGEDVTGHSGALRETDDAHRGLRALRLRPHDLPVEFGNRLLGDLRCLE